MLARLGSHSLARTPVAALSSLTRTLALALALALSLSLSHSLSLARRLSRSLARSLARTVTHSISLSPALSLSYSLALCLALSHPRSLFLARSRIRSRSCARSLSPRSPSAPRRLPLSSALGLSPQLACSRAQQEQSPQHACSPTAPRRRPQQRPRPLTTACLHAGAAATAPFPPLCGVGQAHSSSSLQKSPLRQAACGCHGASGGTLSPAAPRLARVAAGASRRAARRPTAAIAH